MISWIVVVIMFGCGVLMLILTWSHTNPHDLLYWLPFPFTFGSVGLAIYNVFYPYKKKTGRVFHD